MEQARLEDIRSARLTCILANAYRDTKRHTRPFELEDFLLLEHDDEPRREQDPDEMLLMIMAINDIFGGTVIVDGQRS